MAKINEKTVVGGGQTGVSSVPDPVGDNYAKNQASIKSKIGVIAGLLAQMVNMTKADLDKLFPYVKESTGLDDEPLDIETVKAVVSEDVASMLRTEGLTEQASVQITALFEAAVSTRLVAERARIEEEAEQRIVEEVETIVEELDSYLSAVVEQWLEDNEIAIESGRKVAMAESLIDGIVGLLGENRIDVPEDSVGLVEQLESDVTELEGRLSRQIDENVELRDLLTEKVRDEVFDRVTEGLVETDVEKFRRLTEDIAIGNDVDSYLEKLLVIRESHFGGTVRRPPPAPNLNEEVVVDNAAPTNETVSAIARAIGRR